MHGCNNPYIPHVYSPVAPIKCVDCDWPRHCVSCIKVCDNTLWDFKWFFTEERIIIGILADPRLSGASLKPKPEVTRRTLPAHRRSDLHHDSTVEPGPCRLNNACPELNRHNSVDMLERSTQVRTISTLGSIPLAVSAWNAQCMNAKVQKISEPLLVEIARRIVDHFNPDKIILFGSYAYGAPRNDSDLDLLVIMDTEMRPAARSAAVARICRPKYVAMDIVVRTPEEIQTRLRNFDPFLEEIFKLGRTLYESTR